MLPTAVESLQAGVELYLQEHQQKELVRFVVVGSVDDGKSTFIGRLLYETNGLYEDQIAQVRRASKQGGDDIDFSLFTDGLKAEREQAITIDVAYRYFSSQRRKYIIADTPGHVQYTRNMATGASTADVAIILVDARHGLLPQGRRHAMIASLLGIPELVVAVNKMDLVGYDEGTFRRLADEFATFASSLGFRALHFFPVSARLGDNVVKRSERMPWHQGGTVFEFLENVTVQRAPTKEAWRFPVQYVLRPHLDYRAFAGQVVSGQVSVGDEVVVLPSGRRTRVKAIDTYEGELSSAVAPLSVALRLEDEVDVSRGDLLAHPSALPWVTKTFDAKVVWLNDVPLDPSREYLLKHGTRTVPARISAVRHRTDLETLKPVAASKLELNDLGHLGFELRRPIFADAYTANRHNGAFILIDAVTNDTVAAGMVLPQEAGAQASATENATGEGLHAGGEPRPTVSRVERQKRLGHPAAFVWVEAVSGEGEASALGRAYALERALFDDGILSAVVIADGAAARACVEAGLVTIVVAEGSAEARGRLRAALRVADYPLLEAVADAEAARLALRAALEKERRRNED